MDIKEIGTNLYNKWIEIKQVRKDLGYRSTNVKLSVEEFEVSVELGGGKDTKYHLTHEKPSDKTD